MTTYPEQRRAEERHEDRMQADHRTAVLAAASILMPMGGLARCAQNIEELAQQIMHTSFGYDL